MTFAFKWLMRIFLALLFAAAMIAILTYYLASRSLPDYSQDHNVSGITAPVRIVRNTANVPHIFGETDVDSYFGLGFAHAQDRLWQMTMLRRTVQGRLSELFGPRTVKTDEVFRRFDLYRLSQKSVAHQDAYTTAALQAYADGVNAWLAEINKGSKGRGAPEFFLFGAEIAPWQPADSLAIGRMLALQLTSHLDAEVLRARTALTISPERLADILPDVPGPGLTELSAAPGWLRNADPHLRAQGPDFRDDPISPIKRAPFAGASNAWAAAPARSASGGTLLANDPHLGLTAPSIWYLARLELAGGGVIGGTIPGAPVVLVGRNSDLAWGLTTAYVDDVDIYIEKLNPADRDQYLDSNGEHRPFRSEGSVIRVKDAPPVTVTLQWTERGPVMPADVFDLGTITPPGHVTSVAWTALSEADTTVSAMMALMQARSISEALESGEKHIAPAQNLTLVDHKGIAMQVVGALPARDPAHDSLGRLPAPGWEARNQWNGRLDYALNPSFVDPDGGLLGNTNNKTIDRDFPLHVSYLWGDTQRVYRWQKLMQDRQVHTRESFIEAQLDTVSISARTLLPLIGAELWFTGEAAPEGTAERQRSTALNLMAEWNGDMNEHEPEPLIYAAWIRALQKRLITDELGGPISDEFTHVNPLFLERVYRDINGASAWCDVKHSAPTETCADMARLALDDALVWIGETYGGSLESLHWGDAHLAMHDHQVLGDHPLLGLIFNIRQSTSGGNNTLMRGRTSGQDPHPFQNVHAAAYRGVYDMADPDSSAFIISTGQSGHPLSRFYDNLGERWRQGEYIPMSLDPDLAEAAATGVTTLTPLP